jgi:hypothetical protein
MAALMVALLASAIATLGSRWSSIAALTIAARRDGLGWLPVMVVAVAASVLAATFGIEVAARYRGPGMLLLLALALLFAAPALLWPVRKIGSDVGQSLGNPLKAGIVLAAAMISDGAPFIIFAVAAWTGAWVLTMAGGVMGLIAAVAAMRMFHRDNMPSDGLRWLRVGLGVLLIFIALFTALAAFNARGVVA